MKFVLAFCLAAVSLALCSAKCETFLKNCHHATTVCDDKDLAYQLCRTSKFKCRFEVLKCEVDDAVKPDYVRSLCILKGAEVKINCDIPKDAPLPFPDAPASTANDPTAEIK